MENDVTWRKLVSAPSIRLAIFGFLWTLFIGFAFSAASTGYNVIFAVREFYGVYTIFPLALSALNLAIFILILGHLIRLAHRLSADLHQFLRNFDDAVQSSVHRHDDDLVEWYTSESVTLAKLLGLMWVVAMMQPIMIQTITYVVRG